MLRGGGESWCGVVWCGVVWCGVVIKGDGDRLTVMVVSRENPEALTHPFQSPANPTVAAHN